MPDEIGKDRNGKNEGKGQEYPRSFLPKIFHHLVENDPADQNGGRHDEDIVVGIGISVKEQGGQQYSEG